MRSRFNDILCRAVGSDQMHFRAILDSTGSVLLSSPALDSLLYGITEPMSPDLRIAASKEGAITLIENIQIMGFKPTFEPWANSFDPLFSTYPQSSSLMTASMAPQPMLSAFIYESFERSGVVITIIHGTSSSVMPIVLSQRSTTDCIFVTSGGLFVGYPAYLKEHVAYMPTIQPQSLAFYNLANRGYNVQMRNDRWAQSCGSECPRIWRRIPDSQLIQWGDGLSPFSVLNGRSFLWRLSRKCYNPKCALHSSAHGNPRSVPTSSEDVMLAIEEAQKNNVLRMTFLWVLINAC